MKASTILKLIERALNPDLKEAHIKAYAEAMIKADRLRIKEQLYTEEWQYVDQAPIILD